MTKQNSEVGDVSSALSGSVIRGFQDFYHDVGPGQSEKVYANGMCVALQYLGIRYEREVRYPVIYRGVEIGLYKADFVIEGTLLVELKAAASIGKEHIRQVLYYLRASKLKLGLILNFGPSPTIKRVVL